MPTKPLTDAEIAIKFEVPPGTPEFGSAKRLSLGRPDYTINDLPMFMCPHCGRGSRADDYQDVEAGDE